MEKKGERMGEERTGGEVVVVVVKGQVPFRIRSGDSQQGNLITGGSVLH